jgi:cation diffusion facilitator CzcD-associated flavoprotein CzcO
VDIPAVFYSLSFAPNPQFSKAFPKQQEILQYFNDVADRFDVARHFVCEVDWEEAHWQEASNTWLVKLKNLSTGESFQQQCALLVSAVGGLSVPNKCRLDGAETFEGDIVHTARWKNDLSIKNKNVVVVGNGCE